MTNEQINIAIAEACGWTDVWNPVVWNPLMSTLPVGTSPENFFGHIPNYCNDLNAMHEAEKTLTNVQHRQYRREIWHSVNEDLSSYEKVKAAKRAHFSSTALQKAEAFLRVKDKWEEASK